MIDLAPQHLETVKRLLAEHVPDCEVRAFGSRVSWTAKDYSDLDLAIVGDQALDADVLRRLGEALQESDLPFRVDVLDWHAISESFRKVIQAQYEVMQPRDAEGSAPWHGQTGELSAMASEWTTLRLGSVCSKIGSGATPRGGSSVYLDEGEIVLIRSQNIHNNYFHHDGLTYLTEQHATELSNVEVLTDDVLLNITGDSVARSCQVDPGILPARVNQHVAIIRTDPSVLCPRFLRYFLVSPAMQAEMLSLAGAGATRNALTKGMIESFEVSAPIDVGEQQAIAHILGTLDDKIELNRRMNETLEAMARAIFKSWFVDFDSVRAKAAGQKPVGLAPHIADLFPDSFEDSELGKIPKGWKVGALSDMANVVDCLHAKKPERCDIGRPFLQLNNISNNGLIDIDGMFCISDADYEKWVSRMEAEKGDCVITNVGRVGAVAQIPEGFKAALGRNMTGIRCRSAFPFPTFLIECLLSDAMRDEIAQKTDSGTILNALNVKNIPKLRLVLPSGTIVKHLEGIVRPLRKRMEKNLLQSRTLVALRDVLLVRLISGDLRVQDAEKELEVMT